MKPSRPDFFGALEVPDWALPRTSVLELQMTQLAPRIKLLLVSYRAKLVLLIVVLGAILYVLISPLRELAATSNLKFAVLPLLFIVLILSSHAAGVQLLRIWRNLGFTNSQILLARSCVMLC